ncbi:hypothetical protein NLX85_18070 [Micromonospora sp. A3M-1-15]|uniref:hypothetical protein n=1 Tax=Micromonospora sp. A3M-1-15 TaxID=2962035 RepID=UPI0020B7EF61|nr:hypothetical protein [Micromonospora sp. A3M-1-15]MCP3785275.1 hypothetical protein [Micromonospora sp. A3M-1-15]
MYELNRIRLFGVGPRGARYTDVTLDLSGVGATVGGQGALFGAPTRRPSPYSLLLLENGGGKSVLLKLLFSVVLPGRRNTVGGPGSVMEKFVVGDDAAHVVLEWMNVRTGGRVITGKTLQRRRSASAAEKLSEQWWSLRPHADVEIDSLPFSADGRRLRVDGFKEALQEIDRTAPVTQLTWVGAEISGWEGHLRSIGIEPDLFRIQRRMNADEGDAATAFKFKSSRDFIDWLLKVVLDPADAVSVADNFESYARTVGDRAAMLLERDFVDGAVASLRPLADAQDRHRTACTARQVAEDEGLMLLRQIRARETAEAAATSRLRELAAGAAEIASGREKDRDRARDIVNETRRQTLALEHAAAQQEQRDAIEGRDGADADLRAWELAGLIERRNTAAQSAARFTEQIVTAEREARPALQGRDAAAGELLSKLAAEVSAGREKQGHLNDTERDLRARAAEIDDDRSQTMRDAERWRSEQAQINDRITESRHLIDAAVADGLLAVGEDVKTAAADAQQAATTAAAQLRTAEQDAKDAQAAVRETSRLLKEAGTALNTARTAHGDAARAVQTILDRAAPLISDDLVRTALSADEVDVDMLDSAADAVIDRLHGDAKIKEQILDDLRAEQRDDQRLLEALGDGGFLPPRDAVETTLTVLHHAGIGAHAGWRYLAENVPADERDAVIADHPHLADGVIIVNPAALDMARQALQDAQLLPAAAVAVGTGLLMLTTSGAEPAADGQFVIEPNPALFDPEAAEQRREQLRTAMITRGSEISASGDDLAHLRDVHIDLVRWRRDYPPGRLAELRESLGQRETELGDAVEAEREARTAADAAEAAHDRIAGQVDKLRTAERAAADRSGALARLEQTTGAAEQLRAKLPELAQQISEADRTVREMTADREQKLREATEAARSAQDAAARVERHRADMRDVVTSTGEHAAAVPLTSVSDLRSAYLAAAAAYAAVEVGQDMRAAATTADLEAARLREEVGRHEPADVDRAEQLLATPEGADEAGRQTAIARTRRERERFADAVSAADTKVGGLASDLKAATPAGGAAWIQLPESRRPTNVEHGRRLTTTAIAEHRDAQHEYETAVSDVEDLNRKVEVAKEAARAFREIHGPLAVLLADPPADPDDPIEAYDGDSDGARAATSRVQQTLSAAVIVESSTGREVNRLVDHAVRHANQAKFEKMSNMSRRAIVGLDRDQLAARAAEFTTQLEQRLATLTTDLDSAGQHRKMIVDRLSALVVGALKTLRTASRLSKLPAGLGEWEGKEFLRIRFSEPDPALLHAHVGEVVDDMSAAATARASSGTAPKRDGMVLLLRSIEAAVPKGFTVDLLKPDAVLRDERVPIENMNEVFSGGQELTAAIVLYCTMAALRANERGQMRTKHSGVLFLDNPIGKASAEYLLELQQGVAATLGVQLVYTTGLSDDRALAAFPLWVRMRNDADLRAGLKHIRVAEVVRRQLPDPFTDADAAPGEIAPGTITATRVYRRPA